MEIPFNFSPEGWRHHDVSLNTSRNITWLFKFYFTFYFVILQSEAISDFLLSFCVWHLSVYECHFREKVSYVDSKRWPYLTNETPYRHTVQYKHEYVIYHTCIYANAHAYFSFEFSEADLQTEWFYLKFSRKFLALV